MSENRKFISIFMLGFILIASCRPVLDDVLTPTGSATDENLLANNATVDAQSQKNQQTNSPVSGGTIFFNGTILLMDSAQTVVEAILILEDKIAAIGSEDDILSMAGEGTILVNLNGATIMPGFVDAHAHSFNNIWRDDFEAGQQFMLSHGITTTAEMFVEEALINDLQAFDESGQLRMRVSLYPVRVDNCGEDRGEWYWPEYPPALDAGALLQIPGIKIFSDGGSCNRPARSFIYSDGSMGDLYHDADTLALIIQGAQSHGYQVAIHGLGDRAINVNLDALEMALAGEPNVLHHRLEHNTLLEGKMFDRYSEVDPVALIFGAFPACFFVDETGQYQYTTPEENIQMEWAWRPLIDANPNVHFAWHSDAPVFGNPLPMENIYGFLTRRQYREDGSVCEPTPWAADDLLTIDEVLPMMTIEAAYAIRRNEEIGSLEPGKLADLIVLPINLLTADPESIRETQILMTMVAGKVEWCLPGSEAFCPGQADTATEPGDLSLPFGYLDFPFPGQTLSGTFFVEGWSLDEDGPIDRVEVYLDDEYIGEAEYGIARPDVANVYPGRDGSPDFGYSYLLDTTKHTNGPHTLSIHAFGPAGDEGLMIPEILNFNIEN